MLKGIDVSGSNRIIDFTKVKKDNNFVILKLGNIYDDEKFYIDSKFERNYKECQKLGIPTGIYIYNYCNSVETLKKEIKEVLEYLEDRVLQMPIYLDMEDKSIKVEGKETLTQQCIEFTKLIEVEGYRAGIYANLDWFKNYIDTSKFDKNVSVWVAQYYKKCEYEGKYDIWQYSSDGRVDGVSGRVDMNYLYNESIINKTNDGEVEENNQETKLKYKVGDTVSYNKIYSSSTSTTALNPLIKSGKITKIYPGTHNPYLINNSTGFVNDNCITNNSNSSSIIKKGDKVKVVNAIQYDGKSFAKYYDIYNVIEINGDRAVIGVGNTVTCAINTKNIQKI